VNIFILNPSTSLTKNVVRDVLYGCWCNGKRIGGGTVPPFALLQVATVLKNDGNVVEFLDAQAEQTPPEEIIPRIADTDMVVISTSTMTFEEDARTLLMFKKTNPNMLTIVFGSHPTFLPKATLSRPGVDIAVRHEPEYIVRDLARRIRRGENWKNIQGIAFGDGDQVIINPPYPFIENLDELPFPDVSLLPKEIDYFNPIVRRMPYMTASTSRGCPGRCSFCTAPAFDGKRLRFQSAEYVIKEIEYFLNHGVREIYFRDDTFFVNKKRDRAICRAIIEKNLDVSWLGNARIGMIDFETIKLAKDAGCHTIKFGIESGDQTVLNRSHKGYKLEQAYETFRWTNELGITTHAHCMLGMPGDNEKTIQKTIQFVKDLNATTATFGICTPYPGAPLYDEVLQAHPEIGDGSASDLSKLHVEGLFNEIYADVTKERLEQYITKAYRSFYLRPKLFLTILKQIRSLEDIKRITLSGARVIDFALFGNKTN
jgi:anaerobic magnesium-protoporphyrin IX monomethyl ester cyclase